MINRIFTHYNQEKAVHIFCTWNLQNKRTRTRARTHTHTHTHTGSPSTVLFNMCYVFFSYTCILIGKVSTHRYILIAMYNSVPPFHEATFCSVLSCVFNKLGSDLGETKFMEHCATVIYRYFRFQRASRLGH
jgi:hypothetical protein